MYLDCVGRQTTAVVEPWRNARKHVLSYFCWQVAIDLVAGVAAFALAAARAGIGGLLGDCDFRPTVQPEFVLSLKTVTLNSKI